MEEKRVLSNSTIPPALVRLAAVLAEIAQNEPNSASTTEPVCPSTAKNEQNTENAPDG